MAVVGRALADQIEHLVQRQAPPLYRGVYAVGHRPVGPRSREMAVVLLAGVAR